MQGTGLRVWGVGFENRGLRGGQGVVREGVVGFVFRDLGFGIWDLGFGIWDLGSGFWVQGFGCRVKGLSVGVGRPGARPP